MSLGRSQGFVCCFFSIPNVMNYKIEPKLTVKEDFIRAPHLDAHLGESLSTHRLFDLIKGSCFSIDFSIVLRLKSF